MFIYKVLTVKMGYFSNSVYVAVVQIDTSIPGWAYLRFKHPSLKIIKSYGLASRAASYDLKLDADEWLEKHRNVLEFSEKILAKAKNIIKHKPKDFSPP